MIRSIDIDHLVTAFPKVEALGRADVGLFVCHFIAHESGQTQTGAAAAVIVTWFPDCDI